MSTQLFTDWTRAFSFFAPRPGEPGAADKQLVAQIRETAGTCRQLADEQLRQRVAALRDSVMSGQLPINNHAILAQGFALVNEATRRSLGIEFYDVQLMAGRALICGTIAELATGEGKTLVQALAAFVFALAGRGVHVMTSNAYLAGRDYHQLSPVLARLGMTVGLLRAGASADQKRQAYLADITYGAGYEFGFDYLRDQVSQLKQRPPALGETYQNLLYGHRSDDLMLMQRDLACAIVDEADSVLIDEATTPLILSALPQRMTKGSESYLQATRVAASLKMGSDFVVDAIERRAHLTDRGMQKILHRKSLPDDLHLDRPWAIYIEQALFASHLLQRDVDYVVVSDQVRLVDQSTGRVFSDRSLRDGLHQAVEAKEGVPITLPRSVQARISRQQYFQLYDTVCGMTGTATGSEREFWSIYRLRIVSIPTRTPCRRIVLPTRFFADQTLKRMAIVEQIRERHATSQPVLVGTRTIHESRCLACLLDKTAIPYQLLNGVQDAAEAELVARAGQLRAVTVATNIAGRGTDIRLGEGAGELGGLHVIATEPHESTRVDRQLVGRCARQGDPGSCQTFVSAEDQMVRLHAPRLAQRMRRMAAADGETHADLSGDIVRVQRRLENLNFERRRKMLSHDRWIEDIMSKLVD